LLLYVCIDWFEKVHPYWEKIMHMYKQIQKKDAQLTSFLLLFLLSLLSIKLVDRKKRRRDKAHSIVVASIDIRLVLSMHEHFISTSSHSGQMHLINWNENGKKRGSALYHHLERKKKSKNEFLEENKRHLSIHINLMTFDKISPLRFFELFIFVMRKKKISLR